nr:DoxX-like family protein [Risungbinella massiliensis]
MKSKPIYVEVSIHSDMDRVWEATLTPQQHEQWDLRFSSITYLPKEKNAPQEFTYETNIGFGIHIAGWGRSVGTYLAEDDSRTSSLHFGTDQKISIIREGKGYWKYQPDEESTTFLTQYDYQVNHGYLGHLFDHFLFRPLLGWATALSFDVLKRWLEKGETPSTQYIRFFSYWIISLLFFFVWTYHGLVPKLISMNPEEINMVSSLVSLSPTQASWVVIGLGIAEIGLGITWLLYTNKRRLLEIQIILFPLLTLSVILADPSYLVHPFNPFTLNISLFVLSVIGFFVSEDVPTAKYCKRQKRGV